MSKRQQDRPANRAQDAAQAATVSAATAAAGAAARTAEVVQRAGVALEQHGHASAPSVGSAVGRGVDTAVETASTAREVAVRVGTVAAAAVGELVHIVQGLVEEPGARGAAALDALRGAPVRPPLGRRRWPWAVAAAVAGASAGGAVAYALRTVEGTDAPDAQEPHELRAVVDVPAGRATTGSLSDQDGRLDSGVRTPTDSPIGSTDDSGGSTTGTAAVPTSPGPSA